jgi:type II secretory pathway predicted ATPase ExeA
MLPVYCKHFGLIREPFSITADPNFLYLSESHEEALSQLVYGIRSRRGLVVLTGEVGTGKTTLIQRLLEEVHSTTKTAYVFNMILGPEDLFRYICEKFGIIDSLEGRQGIHDYISLLERFLHQSNDAGENVALIIDEAQNLNADVLEYIRLLSNFEKAHEKLLQILLVGQPELGIHLNAPELRQVKQRVALRHDLQPLSWDECKKYIAKRLEIAGGSVSLFTGNALITVSDHSNGIPRLINVLCDNGLLAAYASRHPVVESEMIDEVARSLKLTLVRRIVSPISKNVPRETNGRESRFSRTSDIQQSVQLGATNRAEQCDDLKQSDSLLEIDPHLIEMRRLPLIDERQKANVSPKVRSERDAVSPLFFEQMIRVLTDAIGPMALFIVRENVADMGESETAFPKVRLQQLIERASREILLESLRLDFQEVMQAEIGKIESSQ